MASPRRNTHSNNSVRETDNDITLAPRGLPHGAIFFEEYLCNEDQIWKGLLSLWMAACFREAMDKKNVDKDRRAEATDDKELRTVNHKNHEPTKLN